ncbi:cupin domain-containing protein [Qiania dongpingensis]|uniref:Cupin domain-containing protein n=1 Tax=Qiania dongpingensis TaxID=2763669 RepID=A0A7G9G6S6_9FIRM|nr:cupin domain-containing protein [Qiania dongpingensis]QNM06508.1 cupin domain-containing protein [Qiania dongpingensis]
MVRYKEKLISSPRPNMLGGEGTAMVTPLFEKGEYRGHARLMSVLTLEPGCTVGEHKHEGEEEFVYILSGNAIYYDNGVQKEMKAGDTAITISGQTHRIDNKGTESLKYLAMVLTYDEA